ETPNLHQHTLKVAVVDASDYASREGGDFTFELFRRTLWRRLNLLEPLRKNASHSSASWGSRSKSVRSPPKSSISTLQISATGPRIRTGDSC
ncbi:MAG: Diacylglycerol O-acyltransferase, partial [Mycobacterium sp.]|nr:Diacylglycerol O-acyltransferase [Mycobacterium sp.]